MKVAEIMSRAVCSVAPTESIADTARLMAELDIGALPVEDDGRLVGIVTDRDIAVRGVAAGLHDGAPVLRIMSKKVITCREDDELSDVLAVMARQQVRRIPVCNEKETLVGMLSLGDAARRDSDRREVADAIGEISLPRGLHCQSLEPA